MVLAAVVPAAAPAVAVAAAPAVAALAVAAVPPAAAPVLIRPAFHYFFALDGGVLPRCG